MVNEQDALRIFNSIYTNLNLLQAEAYGINFQSETNGLTEHTLISKGGDVYELIDRLKNDESSLIWDAIAVTTTGWAAPIDPANQNKDEDVPPSQHPDRVRVYLMSIVTPDQKIASILKLDNEEEPSYDTSGTGNLADSLKSIYKKGKTFNERSDKFLI